ncbi:hypothetical protein BFW01_g2001 [Lasiodiplodia theobromae]|nr:hypothetical protein BFW01_g2001 [Lasiodiplodia theobromae]
MRYNQKNAWKFAASAPAPAPRLSSASTTLKQNANESTISRYVRTFGSSLSSASIHRRNSLSAALPAPSSCFPPSSPSPFLPAVAAVTPSLLLRSNCRRARLASGANGPSSTCSLASSTSDRTPRKRMSQSAAPPPVAPPPPASSSLLATTQTSISPTRCGPRASV